MRKIYRKIARENGVTLAEVKRDMQAAIDVAYTQAPHDGVMQAYQNSVHRKDEIPTANEFIRHVTKEIRNRGK